MIWLKRILTLLFVMAALLVALAFMTINESVVSVDFFLWQPSASVGVWMILAFIVGLAVTLLLSYPLIAAYQFRLRRAQKKQLELSASAPQDS